MEIKLDARSTSILTIDIKYCFMSLKTSIFFLSILEKVPINLTEFNISNKCLYNKNHNWVSNYIEKFIIS